MSLEGIAVSLEGVAVSLEGVAVSLEGRQLAPSMPILVDPDRRQHVLATHGHSHHRSTFLRRRCCPPTCQRHRHLPQLRQRAQRTAWTSLCPLQELVTRKIDVLLNFDGKQNPADALTKHIEPKATFLDYMARLYNATASLFPLPLQPHHLYGTPS